MDTQKKQHRVALVYPNDELIIEFSVKNTPAEVFDFGRFTSARAFMSYLGLTPSESYSGEKEHKDRITKTGNKRARRLLTEAA